MSLLMDYEMRHSFLCSVQPKRPLLPSLAGSSTGVFCTFNPTYLGRATLPESLTALLRPVAMLLPDKKHIAEAALAAAGFQSAKQLASKTVAFFQTAQETASQMLLSALLTRVT